MLWEELEPLKELLIFASEPPLVHIVDLLMVSLSLNHVTSDACFDCLVLFSFYLIGVVKKMGGGCFKIVHEKHRAKYADEHTEMQLRQMQEIVQAYPDLKPLIQRQVVRPLPFVKYHMQLIRHLLLIV